MKFDYMLPTSCDDRDDDDDGDDNRNTFFWCVGMKYFTKFISDHFEQLYLE